MLSRRQLIALSGAGLSATVAGCLNQGVELTGGTMRVPDAQGISADAEDIEEDRARYTVTLENTGMSGDVDITLVFTDGEQSAWAPSAEKISSKTRFLSAGERRPIEFVAEEPGMGQDWFGFRVTAAEAEVEITNDGDGGEVEITISQDGGVADGTVFAQRTIQISENETKTVHFDLDVTLPLEDGVRGVHLRWDASAVDE